MPSKLLRSWPLWYWIRQKFPLLHRIVVCTNCIYAARLPVDPNDSDFIRFVCFVHSIVHICFIIIISPFFLRVSDVLFNVHFYAVDAVAVFYTIFLFDVQKPANRVLFSIYKYIYASFALPLRRTDSLSMSIVFALSAGNALIILRQSCFCCLNCSLIIELLRNARRERVEREREICLFVCLFLFVTIQRA